jgi:hypothetical protein
LNSTHCQGKHHEKFNASIAFAALLLSGTAFAGSVQPVAGEAPWFNAPVQAASSVQRQDVQADAARHLPVAGEMAPRRPAVPSTLTRAEVRQATRDAIAKGYAAVPRAKSPDCLQRSAKTPGRGFFVGCSAWV